MCLSVMLNHFLEMAHEQLKYIYISCLFLYVLQLYRGRLENGTQVAIRSLLISKKFSIRNLKLRLDMLGKLRHPNLVCLLGHCIDGDGQDFNDIKVFLVSEYVPNGSFRTHLSGNLEAFSD